MKSKCTQQLGHSISVTSIFSVKTDCAICATYTIRATVDPAIAKHDEFALWWQTCAMIGVDVADARLGTSEDLLNPRFIWCIDAS